MTNELQNPTFLEQLGEEYGTDPDFRADVPVGTEIGHKPLGPGADASWKKSSSKMRVGNKELPDRIPLYDNWTHDRSMVPPTIANKRMSEHPGRFFIRKPAGWDERNPVPIDDTCQICARVRIQESGPGTPPKPFYDREQLRMHMRYMHQNEWDAIEQNRRDDERREDQNRMERLVASIAAMVNPGIKLPSEVAEQITGLQQDATEPQRRNRR